MISRGGGIGRLYKVVRCRLYLIEKTEKDWESFEMLQGQEEENAENNI